MTEYKTIALQQAGMLYKNKQGTSFGSWAIACIYGVCVCGVCGCVVSVSPGLDAERNAENFLNIVHGLARSERPNQRACPQDSVP